MHQFIRAHRLTIPAIVVLFLSLSGRAVAQVPGWDSRWPPVARVVAGCDPKLVREFQVQSAALAKNSNDEDALVNRAVVAHRLARTSRLDLYLDWLAAKDLEKAVKLDPKDFAAWHNYGDLNYSSGDDWMHNDHSNARRALWAFNHAVALNPKSARTYMGRGWTYYELDDQAHANADFQKALQLDPSLRADINTEVKNIQERHQQAAAAKGTVAQMARYFVLKSAHTESQCAEGKGYWTNGECRVSMALYPGPTQSWEGH
jgi:tetratricopeptide (TPR) repeat protein